MVSRAAVAAMAIVVAGIAASSTTARTPPHGTAMFLVQHDTRLCPSPACGGYWVALANGVRTRCGDGRRRTRCYVARVVDRSGRAVSDIPEGALTRGAVSRWSSVGDQQLDQLLVFAVYAASRTEPVGGGWYRIVDNGIRCVRAPCFSYRATPVNGAAATTVSSVDLEAAGATSAQLDRARIALASKDGLYAQGRFARAPDGGRVFRALRLYLRVPLPRA